MLRLRQLLPALVIALSAGACAGNSGPQDGPLPPRGNTATVRVTNNNWADMNVYAERGGMRLRLGTVTTMATRAFKLPRTLMNGNGNVRLVADPIGSRESHVTSPVQVWPGQTVAFRIENHIAISSITVR
jgi:hypothetical protein